MRARWRVPWPQLCACVVMFVGVVIFLYPQTASWFSQKEQSRATEVAQESLLKPPASEPEYRAAQLARAQAYNEALASGAIYEANAHVARGGGAGGAGAGAGAGGAGAGKFDEPLEHGADTDEAAARESRAYPNLLNFGEHGFMGRLLYNSLGIDLPIYHGTSAATLERGIGHLEGTSLPVGGQGARSVLTAHRGLPTATLFNELNRAVVGDTFTLSVLDQVFTYKVVEVQVIEPSETAAIMADPDRDLVTLVTCTPLGINSHRILVTAERVAPTPAADVVAAQKVPDLPGFPWWAPALAVAGVACTLVVWRAGRVRA